MFSFHGLQPCFLGLKPQAIPTTPPCLCALGCRCATHQVSAIIIAVCPVGERCSFFSEAACVFGCCW